MKDLISAMTHIYGEGWRGLTDSERFLYGDFQTYEQAYMMLKTITKILEGKSKVKQMLIDEIISQGGE